MEKAFVFYTSDFENKSFCYLLWFQPDFGVMISKNDYLFVLLNSNYFGQKDIINIQNIKDNLKNQDLIVEFLLINQNLLDILNSLLTWFEVVLEKRYMTYSFYEIIKKNFGEPSFVDSYFDQFRKIKNEDEINKMKKAINITDEIYLAIQQMVDNWEIIWKSEREIQTFIIKSLLDNWAEKESFDSIVAYWHWSAIPHHQTSLQKISNWVLLIDSGVVYQNYCSDFTRTYRVWHKDENYELYDEIYQIVKTAYFMALEACKPWVPCKVVDKLVRDYFEEKWYLKYFNHSLGHGIGMQAHEMPIINIKSDYVFEENMFFTIEPGIYLPWKFGVRLENTIHMISSWSIVYSKVSI